MKTFGLFLIMMISLFLGSFQERPTDQPPIIQMGVETMPQDNRPTAEGWTIVYRVFVRFPREFRRVPQVQLGMASIEAYSRKSGTFYRLGAENVTTSGFFLNIQGAYMNSFSNCEVSWIAVEQP